MTEIIQFTLGMSNGFILRGEKTILLDAGSELGKEGLMAVFDAHGMKPAEVDFIILSHAHVDHYANIANAKALTGAPVICHEKAAEIIRSAGRPTMYPRNELGRRILADTLEDDPVPVVVSAEPDILLCSEISLKPFGIDGEIIFTPGHSDCSLSILLSSGEAFVGDIMLSCPLDNSLVLGWFANNPEALYNSAELILEKATTIYSGHGGPYTVEEARKAYERDRQEKLR